MGQGFTVGLGGELAQRQFGTFQRIPLGTEGDIAQTRSTVFHAGAIAKARATFAGETTGSCAITGAVAATITSTACTGVLAVTKFAAPTGRGRLCLAHAGAVITAHGHDHLGGLGHRRRRHGFCHWLGDRFRSRGDRGICLGCGRCLGRLGRDIFRS